jgi:putative membrane protein
MQDSDKGASAEERTRLARQRNALANERTFSAWLRTGLGAVAAGVAIVRLIAITEYQWLTLTLGGVFILGGIIVFILSIWRYHFTARELAFEKTWNLSLWMIGILVFLFVVGSILSFILLLL